MSQKKMIIVGEPTGRSSKWNQIWEQWAEHNGYEIVRKSLSEICPIEDENRLLILDEYGLNDDPLPTSHPQPTECLAMNIKAGDTVRRIKFNNGPAAKIGQLATVKYVVNGAVEVKYPGNRKETADGCEVWLLSFVELVQPTPVS